MNERLLTARELGEHLGLSTSTVLDRFERGDLPGFRLFGKKGGPVRFRAAVFGPTCRVGATPLPRSEVAERVAGGLL